MLHSEQGLYGGKFHTSRQFPVMPMPSGDTAA